MHEGIEHAAVESTTENAAAGRMGAADHAQIGGNSCKGYVLQMIMLQNLTSMRSVNRRAIYIRHTPVTPAVCSSLCNHPGLRTNPLVACICMLYAMTIGY